MEVFLRIPPSDIIYVAIEITHNNKRYASSLRNIYNPFVEREIVSFLAADAIDLNDQDGTRGVMPPHHANCSSFVEDLAHF